MNRVLISEFNTTLKYLEKLNEEENKMHFDQETVTIPKEEYEAIMAKYNELMSRNVKETIIENLAKHEDEDSWFYASELKYLNTKDIVCFDGQMIIVLRFDPDKFELEKGELFDVSSGCAVTGAPAMIGDGMYFISSVNSRTLEGFVNPKASNSEYVTVCKFLKL